MAPTVQHTLGVARSQLGTVEPVASQVTKYNAWYADWSGLDGYRDTYWCATFCSWVLSVAGFSVTDTGRFGNVNPWIRWLKGKGMWHSTPKVGALVMFDWDGDGSADHIGFVEEVRSDGRIQTVEGNATVAGKRDGVWRVIRRSGIVGYGWLPYAAPPKPGPVPVPAPGSVVTPVVGGRPSQQMPGPVVIPKGAGLAPWTIDARFKRWTECPQMPVGFGGPEDPAQRAWVGYWYALMARFSPVWFAQVTASTAGRREVARLEVGQVTVAVVEKMLRQVQKTYSFRGVIPPVAWSLYQPR